LESYFKEKTVVVTGGCGTVGKELVRQLLELYSVGQLIVLDNNESELFYLTQLFAEYSNAHFYLCDIRDEYALTRKLHGADIVFHTAAFKHVILCEQDPHEAMQTNINGVDNVIRASVNAGVSKVIFTSSDKAVNPTNVMGTSKLMGERLMTAANAEFRNSTCIFASTRFGNVLGSRGSVIPIFDQQISKGGPITLTHSEMTRFIMSIEQSVQLVIDSAMLAKGGEVFVTKMPVISIKDLAEVMIGELASSYGYVEKDIEINEIGIKPGEKLYEELMTSEETARAIELENYFVIKPSVLRRFSEIEYTYDGTVSETVNKPYNSAIEPKMSQAELTNFLHENKLLK
jgi:FlaA1/EpsC-like NDP-sugar epimerase